MTTKAAIRHKEWIIWTVVLVILLIWGQVARSQEKEKQMNIGAWTMVTEGQNGGDKTYRMFSYAEQKSVINSNDVAAIQLIRETYVDGLAIEFLIPSEIAQDTVWGRLTVNDEEIEFLPKTYLSNDAYSSVRMGIAPIHIESAMKSDKPIRLTLFKSDGNCYSYDFCKSKNASTLIAMSALSREWDIAREKLRKSGKL